MVAAQETTLRDLLAGAIQFVVPLYQRPYQWGTSQLKALWDDITELAESRLEDPQASHFIGSLVLAPTPAAIAGSVTSHLVVDGQQRLTTLTILLAAIRDYLHRTEPDGFGDEEIQESYLVNKFKKGSAYLKLVPTQQDRESYSAIISGNNDQAGEDAIGTAYRFFSSQLESLDDPDSRHDVEALQEAVVSGLALVSISTHRDDNVHRIFQSLNNTGLKLTQGDLLRNYIFMRLPQRGDDVYRRYWKPLQNLLTNDELENLFWIDLAAYHPTAKIGDTFLYQQRRLESLTSEKDVEEEVGRFFRLAKLYNLVLHPEEEEDPRVRFRLNRLKQWGMQVTQPAVLGVLSRRASDTAGQESTARALHVIESYVVRRFLAGRASQGLNRLFREAATSVSQQSDSRDLDLFLSEWLSTGRRHFYSDEKVVESVLYAPYFLQGRRNHRKIFLEWLEEEFGSLEPIDTSSLSIEHVMPQTLNTDWRRQLDTLYPNDDIDELQESLVHTLGNLTLTGYNSTLSNKSFDWKASELKSSGLRLSRSISDQDVWGPEQIKARGQMLAALIIERWPGPNSTTPVPADDNPLWNKLRQVLSALPTGRWTSYGDLASVIGTAAQPVGNYIANTTAQNAYRVLRRDGKTSDGFRWLSQEYRDLTQQQVLESEGVIFDDLGRASQSQRLDVDDLMELAGWTQPQD
ncbi:GmrSD restriction endonuclease domain-containing protein [Corynebacterium pacaense]|uniref:GmrSD restriction endonuclease domain-containing protein n=1 Tax=Corynebacterium pacaense TaxID=1816684 RepID=UPI0009BA3EE2|nr:DUF262 domain-containing protein [Corynebacterium pacaense]